MKNVITLLLFTIAICQLLPAQTNKKRKLVWSEEFNYTGLPDSTKWRYEEGLVRNNEEQYYTVARKQNAWVAHGVLTITGRKERYPNKFYKPGSTDPQQKEAMAGYTSAALITLNKKHFTYGRVEVRAKIPRGLGVWPAIWMLGVDSGLVRWPYCGEIDIMEFVGHDSTHIHGTIHYADSTAAREHKQSGGNIKTLQPYNGFHIYAAEWTSKGIDIFFDDSLYHHFNTSVATYKGDNAFTKPFYLLINLALGGDWGKTIDYANLPQQYQVDYVRVYQ